MYKILLLVFAASALVASSVGVGDLKDGSTIVSHGKETTFIYNRLNLSVKHQNPSNDAFNVQTNVCDIPKLAKTIETEPVTFIYVYLDGAMVIRVDSCK